MTRILVIEDEHLVRGNIAELLAAEGFDILQAGDGEEGVRVARGAQPDLILCDIRMPLLDGYGVLARLSHDRLTETIPFIFLTARTERLDQRIGMGLGADDYITKPFTRKDLLNSIRKRLEKQQVLVRQSEEKYKQLQEGIARSLPLNLLSPLSVLLGNAELLAESETIASDPAQVRGVARGMRRAAARLVHLVRSYMLYLELDTAQSNPARRDKFRQERLILDGMEIAQLLRGVAREFGREEDLRVEIYSAVLKMSESVFFTLLEELADQAFRRSRLGNAVEVHGQVQKDAYHLTISSQSGLDPAALLLTQNEDTPLGFLLARRIVEIYDGELEIQDSREGFTRVGVNLPHELPV
jgi:two-component system, sensor histidine kinase and response regulator